MNPHFFLALGLLSLFFGCVQQAPGSPSATVQEMQVNVTVSAAAAIAPELVVYTYDGIDSDWGLGPKIFPQFEEQCKCKVKVVAKGDVGAIVSQLIFEKANPQADVALGIDNTFKPAVVKEDLLEAFEPKNFGVVKKELFDGDYRFVPFDAGPVAFVYDSEAISANSLPKSLEDLTKAIYRKKIVIEDARTSSTGKVFFYWVLKEFGEEGARKYLERLKPNLLSVTPGWSEAYNLFLNGEAPIVLSYATSPAYHIVNDNTTKYKALIFPKHYLQIEYVGVVKGAKHRELAREFVEFMLSKKAQDEIPLGNYMFPASAEASLPSVFADLPKPEVYGAETVVPEETMRIWESVFS